MTSTKGSLAPGNAFPFHVNSRVPLEIITSSIPNAGRGLALLGEVKEGDLIFSISKPLLCIIGDGIEKLSSTCDNCFATNTYFHLNPRDAETSPGGETPVWVSLCEKCHMVCYCSEECQDAAWSHHHIAECEVLAELNKRFVKTESRPWLAWGLTYRTVIRFLSLLSNNMISDEDHESFKALCRTEKLEDEGEHLDEGIKLLVAVLEAVLKIQVTPFDIMVFIHKFKANRVNLSTPISKNNGTNLPSNRNFSNSGYCLEPFVALINHSCEPNAHYVFEGTELRVRASRNIAKSEEVIFSYLGQVGDYEGRRQLLQRLWGIRCTCPVCAECLWNDDYGFRAATEELSLVRAAIRGVYTSRPPPSPDSLAFAIGVLECQGRGYGVPSMLEAHQLLILLHTNNNNVQEALKVALKTRYVVEPEQKPKMQLKDSLITLLNLILLMQSPKQPEEISALCNLTLDALRRGYLKDVGKCFGENSMVYRHQKASEGKLDRELVDLIKRNTDPDWVDESGWHMTVVRPGENKRRWVENMNKLLAWAGLPSITAEQC